MSSPIVSVESREFAGSDAFGRRDRVFLPSPSCLTPTEYERFTGNVSSLRRCGPSSSMRASRRDEIRRELGFRERKMSDNFASEFSGSDVDYRHSMTEHARRISALRSEFLRSSLRVPDAFRRSDTRASIPATAYEVRKVDVYKFPFAEPSETPPPSRTVVVDGTNETDGEIEEKAARRTSGGDKVEHPKEFYKELMKRYSPQPTPVDMKLPPTKPRVVATLSKQSSAENGQTLENEAFKINNTILNKETEELKNTQKETYAAEDMNNGQKNLLDQRNSSEMKENENSKESTDESTERHDRVPEIPNISKPGPVLKNNNATLDDSIPTLLEKISKDAPSDPDANEKKKTKHKRTFLDKLLNRNKNK